MSVVPERALAMVTRATSLQDQGMQPQGHHTSLQDALQRPSMRDI